MAKTTTITRKFRLAVQEWEFPPQSKGLVGSPQEKLVKHDFDVELTVDLEMVAQELLSRAYAKKAGTATAIGGAVRLTVNLPEITK